MEEGDRKRLKVMLTALSEAGEYNKMLDALAELVAVLKDEQEFEAVGRFVRIATEFAKAREVMIDALTGPQVAKVRARLQ